MNRDLNFWFSGFAAGVVAVIIALYSLNGITLPPEKFTVAMLILLGSALFLKAGVDSK